MVIGINQNKHAFTKEMKISESFVNLIFVLP